MIDTLLCRRRAERFAQLLDEAEGSRRHRAEVDAELAHLVAISNQVRATPPIIEASPDFRVSLRAMLIARAEQEGIGAASTDVEPNRARPDRPFSSLRRPALTTTRTRPRTVLIGLVAAGAITVSGISAASESALPGDTLYGVKRSTERAQLALAGSEVNRGQLFLDFASTRLAEARELHGDAVGFARVLDEMDASVRDGVRVFTTSALHHQDVTPLDTVTSFLTGQRRQIVDLLSEVSPVERQRAAESLALLDSVRRRADALRAALACGAPPSTQSDNLGPLPQDCPAGQRSIADGPPAEHHPGEVPRATTKAGPSTMPSGRPSPIRDFQGPPGQLTSSQHRADRADRHASTGKAKGNGAAGKGNGASKGGKGAGQGKSKGKGKGKGVGKGKGAGHLDQR